MKLSGHGLECDFEFAEPDKEGWMQTTIRVRVPAFEGSFECTIQFEEWEEFIRVLRQLEASIGNDAKALWSNMEANVELRFALHKNGALEVQYEFSPETLDSGPTLSGTFQADQSFLQIWLRASREALEDVR
jgi:hypothetical protein